MHEKMKLQYANLVINDTVEIFLRWRTKYPQDMIQLIQV